MAFNRTIVELKFQKNDVYFILGNAFNRTIVELILLMDVCIVVSMLLLTEP